MADSLDPVVALAKRRGFVFPSSEIYGGLQATYDYGPLGVELKRLLKDDWWRTVVREREDVVGLDASIFMAGRVWEVSGHVEGFHDTLVDCKTCKARFRVDKMDDAVCPKKKGKKPGECGGEFTEPRQFNTMFKTQMGAVQDATSTVYLRPETAQGIFVNFKNVLETTRVKIPFGIGQIGKAFRNEIVTGGHLFRMREFEQMELEFFCEPGTDDEWWLYWKDAAPRVVAQPRHPYDAPPHPRSGRRRARPLREGVRRHRVPLPVGLGRGRGCGEPHRLRPQAPPGGKRARASPTETRRRRSGSSPT